MFGVSGRRMSGISQVIQVAVSIVLVALGVQFLFAGSVGIIPIPIDEYSPIAQKIVGVLLLLKGVLIARACTRGSRNQLLKIDYFGVAVALGVIGIAAHTAQTRVLYYKYHVRLEIQGYELVGVVAILGLVGIAMLYQSVECIWSRRSGTANK